MLIATWITLTSTLKAELLRSPESTVVVVVDDRVPLMTVPLARSVSLRVIWSALVTPLSSDPLAARPEGTCTKMAGSMAAAARPYPILRARRRTPGPPEEEDLGCWDDGRPVSRSRSLLASREAAPVTVSSESAAGGQL